MGMVTELDGRMLDSVIFDCDGVLVDITRSYDRTIDLTCRHMLRELAGIEATTIDHGIIDGFKASGGFNDEVDLTYASVLSLYAADRLGRDPREFTLDVASRADSTGIRSVRAYLESVCDISGILPGLGSLEDRHENPVYRTFDQIFFGPELYERMFGTPSPFPGPGMIANDRVILSGALLDTLQRRFGNRMAVVTGRGIRSIRHSLGDMMDYFDTASSAFLEDEPRELAKPNPATLIRAMRSLGSRSCLYVGDSMEDHIMAREASRAGHPATFCAIVGTSTDPGRRRALFERSGADLILESIDEIPKALNLARGSSL